MKRLSGNLLPLIAAAIAILPAVRAGAQPAWQFSDADRIVAIADIHGAYPAFERILSRAGLIDADRAWIGGSTHLVIVGDVLDRGPESRKALDLIRALEVEAPAAGGRVHLVLGNHEVMNLIGDLRYVSAEEFAAFAADETAAEREAGFGRFRASLDETVDELEARSRFAEAYPPGFFAHRRAFAPDGPYGAWLLEHPLLLVVNGVAFVHAGLASVVIESGDTLPAEIHAELVDYLRALESLIAAGEISRMDDLERHLGIAAGLTGNADARRLIELQSKLLFSPDGPVWYRGSVSCNRLTEFDRLQAALAGLGAERLVVGHTPTRDAIVLSRMDLAVLRIDTGMLRDYYGGRASALVIENSRLSALYEDESAAATPIEQPRHVGLRPTGLNEEALESLLARANVTGRRALDSRASLLTLSEAGVEIEALFLPAMQAGVLPPVAAYRLDRLLGLDMVPVTIAREIDGVAGALQFWPARSISEQERQAQGLGGSAWCPLGDQIADLYRFDALIFNPARTLDRIRYSSEDLQLMLMGQELAFTTDRGRPAYLAQVPVELTPAWRMALAALDEAELTATLGDVLDRRRIRALLERRDFLLDGDRR